MKQRTLSIILIILLVFGTLITGCRDINDNPDMIDYEKMTAYAAIHSLVHENQYDYSVNELETDEYGRVLFSVAVTSLYSNANFGSYVVIMQGCTKGGVLYYEDIAYYSGDENEEKTASLKDANDWNTPINESKITKRRMHMEYPPGEGMYFGSTLTETGRSRPKKEWNDYIKIVYSSLNISKDDYEIVISDYDESGKWLLCVREGGTNNTKYFVIASERKVLSFIENDDSDAIISDIISMKQESNWNFTLLKK
ncbi:MAG: hypothetical protein IJT49_05845 [Clostridia bacterium]|nr:hypothetical protein [Clostridia bacterium]